MTLEELGKLLDASIKSVDSTRINKEAAEKALASEVAEAMKKVDEVRVRNEKALGAASQQYDDAVQKVAALRNQLNAELDKIAPPVRIR